MKFLKKHPFAVNAHFEESTVLTFALPKEVLEDFLPQYLTLDTFQDRWAFVAVAMVQTSALRPAGFPKFLGHNFFLIGYRIFVRYQNNSGKNLRGLYILKSETNKKSMEWLGNIFTHYKYTTTDIIQSTENNQKIISSKQSDFSVCISLNPDQLPKVPAQSPFSNWKEAKRFAGPLPHTFSVNEEKKEVMIIRGLRQNWTPQPLNVQTYHLRFLNKPVFAKATLASAFQIKNIPYHWEKGRVEKWS